MKYRLIGGHSCGDVYSFPDDCTESEIHHANGVDTYRRITHKDKEGKVVWTRFASVEWTIWMMCTEGPLCKLVVKLSEVQE